MITVEEACRIVLDNVKVLPPKVVDIRAATGLCLAENVSSDMDMPPFDKSAMDGYAVIAEDTLNPPASLSVVERIAAGFAPTRRLETGQASKIMTGAAIPAGADSVIKVEDTEELNNGQVKLLKRVKKGENVCWKGEDFQAGQVVLKRGSTLRPQEIGVLAMVGVKKVKVFSPPKVGIISTGDELVDISRRPGMGQIRDSNSYGLAAQVSQLQAEAGFLGNARDDRRAIIPLVKKGMKKDVLLLTGGVSMGEYDLVVDVLKELGINIFFQRVALRPGKPVVFGKRGETVVFALPGNPVSTYVTFELFVRPAMRKMMGYSSLSRPKVRAQLGVEVLHKRTRREYRPALLEVKDGRFYVTPVEWHGSADLLGTTRGNSLLIIPEDTEKLSTGQEVEVMLTGEPSAPNTL